MLVSKPYRNWKDGKTYLKLHIVNEGHVVATAKMDTFLQKYSKPVSQINNILSKKGVVEKGEHLTSITKFIKLCGRNDVAYRGNRDDSTAQDKGYLGNFKSLLDIHIDAGDKGLQAHLETCDRNAS